MTQADDGLTPEDLRSLVESGRELTAQVDLEDLLLSVLGKATELTDSPDGSILLRDEKREGFFFASAIGAKAPALMELYGAGAAEVVPLASKAGAAFESQESLVEDGVDADPGHFKGVDDQTSHRTLSMICVPLTASRARLGVMQILNKRSGPYDARDLALLRLFAGQAAIAIHNARLFRSLLAHMGFCSTGAAELKTEAFLEELNRPARSEHVTILFADMRGFTRLCQLLNEPQRIQGLLNRFLTVLSDGIIGHEGIVNKIMGDGVLALFRGGDHAVRSIRCAFAMLEDFDRLKQAWVWEINEDVDFLDLGIGVATDNVIIGRVGSDRIRDFTVIGTAVNRAAAFEKAARGGRRVLVDQVTFAAVKDLVEAFEGPTIHELRKDDGAAGNRYKQYEIKRLKSPVKGRAFISHNHHDQASIVGIVDALHGLGVETWYAKDDIVGGEIWVRSITDGLGRCDVVLVMVSKNSATSKWVKREVEMAASESRLADRIIPILIDDTSLADVHPYLVHLQAVDLRGTPTPAEIAARLAPAALGRPDRG